MSTSKWEARATAETVLSTELNTLAYQDTAISAAIDNSSSDKLYMYAEFELNLGTTGANRAAGAYVGLYILPELDGTNYSYGSDSLIPSPSNLAATFALDSGVTTGRYVVITGVLLPPTSFKIVLENQLGTSASFAASGNTLKMRRYNVQGT